MTAHDNAQRETAEAERHGCDAPAMAMLSILTLLVILIVLVLVR